MPVGVNGNRIKELREAKALERLELAGMAGVGYTTIYKMEAHNHRPRLSTIRAVAEVLKVEPAEIMSGVPEAVGG
jgi:transcriptional regulator with XRE-family HTH domain